MKQYKKKLYITVSPYKKYIEDINFLSGKLNTKYDIFVVYTDLTNNDFIKGKKYNFKLYKINHISDLVKVNNKDTIFIRYGRRYFDYITYYLYNFKLLLLSDGIGLTLGTNNYNIDIIEKRKDHFLKIFYLYFKLYGIIDTFINIYRNRVIKDSTDNYGDVKNYGILELSKIYFTNLKSMKNINRGNKILIIEQPFIKNLEKNKLKNFFNFIDSLAKKNSKYEIIFKIHPRSNENFYKKNIKSDNIRFEKGDIVNFIKKSKYILGFFSTALFSALLFNKKVIVIDPINLFKDIKEFELLKYKNTSYIFKAQDLDSISFNNSGKKKKIKELLFDFEKFKKDISTI